VRSPLDDLRDSIIRHGLPKGAVVQMNNEATQDLWCVPTHETPMYFLCEHFTLG